ncbi:histidine--tRNA ligase [Deltaproteobacteria bacterium Smac51]|nr:histidine--tRNA ligase [Deltaproteobacteria bacterium Smac51]
MSTINSIKGFKDILPADAPFWQFIEKVVRDVSRRYDFEELRPPIAEKTEIFARGIGEATDIVEKEMYSFVDKGEERITLRPEATAGIVRSVLEHHLTAGGRAVRLFCMGPMFRYEKPQKGRQRQFHQIDVEVLGDAGPYVDVEVLSWLNDFLHGLGLTGLMINLNSLGCPECRPAFRELLVKFFTARVESLCPDCQRRLEMNPLRIIDCKNEKCREIVKDAPIMLDHLCGDCTDHFNKVKELLDLLGLKYKVNPFLVRGLDYYTRTAFEVLSDDLGSQSAVAGGGRYDGLCKELGGVDIPAIGFAIGMERLVMLLKEKAAIEAQTPDYYLAVLSEAALPVAFKLAKDLRDNGHHVAGDWEVGSLKSRMKKADKSGAAKTIMIGDDELGRKQAVVRDMQAHEQTELDLAPYMA